MPNSVAERIYKKKSAENYAAARVLQGKQPNAAASRAYYALFLATVSEYERLGIQPQTIDRGSADSFGAIGVKWTHTFVKSHAKMIGLDARQCSALTCAYNLRIKADYLLQEVERTELEILLKQGEEILECLGVTVGV
jgi:uncharacterized protein (UPF0332 family)